MSIHPSRSDDAIVIDPRPAISAKQGGLAGWQIVVVILALVAVGVLGIKLLSDQPPVVAVSAVPTVLAPVTAPVTPPVVAPSVESQTELEIPPQVQAPAKQEEAKPRKPKTVAVKPTAAPIPAPTPAPAKAQDTNGAVDFPVADAQGRTCVDHVIQAVIEGAQVPVHQKFCLVNGALKPIAD